jgi:hypothetical protein
MGLLHLKSVGYEKKVWFFGWCRKMQATGHHTVFITPSQLNLLLEAGGIR